MLRKYFMLVSMIGIRPGTHIHIEIIITTFFFLMPPPPPQLNTKLLSSKFKCSQNIFIIGLYF